MQAKLKGIIWAEKNILSRTVLIAILLLPPLNLLLTTTAGTLVLENGASPIWPTTGVNLAAMLLFGYRVWPATFLSQVICNYSYLLNLTCLPIAAIHLPETLSMAWAINRFCDGNPLTEAQKIFKFVAISALIPIIPSILSILTLYWSGIAEWEAFGETVWGWWTATVMGVIVIVPLLLAWLPVQKGDRPQTEFKWLPFLLFLFGTSVITQLSFGGGYPLEFLLIPLLVCSVFVLGQKEVTLLVLVVSAIAIWGTVKGFGSFVRSSAFESMILLQTFIGVIALTTLVLSATIAEREQAQTSLRRMNAELENRVAERTAQLATAKEKAEVANLAKSTFIANISHELRTPLNAILGFTQIMTRSQTLPGEHQENVNIITRSGEHLLTLINNVLDLSKIEAGRTTLNQKNFDLYCLLEDIEELLHLKAEAKGLYLSIERSPDSIQYICSDEVKLRQILLNLINNGIKFTETGGVSVRVTSRATSWDKPVKITFEVEDTGVGIASEELDQLFKAFAQTASGKQAREGTGLGLVISRSFVELMGGELTVRSQVGKGTTFTFDINAIPVKLDTVETCKPKRKIIALEPGQPRYRILIVDDTPINRKLLLKLLSPLGFELKEASNGREAIDLWENWEPHLIWMDMRMPVINGYEASRRIKATTKGQATAIVALTASAFEEEKRTILSAGCDDLLRKPFRVEDIFETMQRHLGVRYLYESAEEDDRPLKPSAEILTSGNVEQLPRELRQQLNQALLTGNLHLLATVLVRIGDLDRYLSEAIADCCDRFEYQKILNVLNNRA